MEYSVENFISKIQNEKDAEWACTIIYDEIDNLLEGGHFSIVDEILEKIPIDLPDIVLISILIVTFSTQKLYTFREKFLVSSFNELTLRHGISTAKGCIKGLH